LRIWEWFDNLLVPWRIRFAGAAIICLSLLLLAFSFATAEGRMTRFGPPLGADFAGFYNAGQIWNLPAADRVRLYDVRFQDELYHQLLPGLGEEKQLPFVHPPFVAMAFSPLARLSYEWAFGIWLIVSAAMYAGGIFLLRRTILAETALDWPTVLLLTLSFEPFIMECWLGGQLSTLGFLAVSAAIALAHFGRCFAVGMTLGLLCYKPTFLVLILPALAVGRKWQALCGFIATSLILGGITYFGAGGDVTRAYLDVLTSFARTTTGETGAALELPMWKYVDLNSFFRLLLRGMPTVHWLVFALAAAVPVGMLVPLWWRMGHADFRSQQFVWAATLAGTLIINLYVGVYDSILIVPAVLLAASLPLAASFRALLLAIYVVPWFTQPLARHTGFQLYTMVLFVATLYFARRAQARSDTAH
jgi:hypothetical protein